MELRGKAAFVTGGGSGIGRSAALRLAAAGADVAIFTHKAEEAASAAAEAAETGVRSIGLHGDVADADAMQAAIARTVEALGRLDILVINAGINGVWAPLDELEPEEWDETISTNLRGSFLTLRYAIPPMKQRGGSIILVASINGTRSFASAGAAAYATTKAGQLALGQMAALELAPHGIRVNVICPGAIETEIEDNTERRHAERAAFPAVYPFGRIPLKPGTAGTAGDVAELILFLASDRSKHISGTPIWIDGAESLLV